MKIGIAVMADALYTSQHTPTAEDIESRCQELMRQGGLAILPSKLKEQAIYCINWTGTSSQYVGPVAAYVAESFKQQPLATNAALEECYNFAAHSAMAEYNNYKQAADNIKPSDLNQVSAFQWGLCISALGFGAGVALRSRKTSQGQGAATKNNGEDTSMPPSTPAS